jgi:RIO-like serine/threonine protein kinase
MIITPAGRGILTPQELAIISMDRTSVHFREKVINLKDSNCDKSQIYRFGRLIIKTNKPMFTKREVFASMRLSAVSPVFLPTLAYDDHSFVAPYIDGMLLYDSGANLEAINSMSYIIADALLKADIIHGDLHNENIIVTPSGGFCVFDLEQFKPMDKYTRRPLAELANDIFECLTDED